MATTGLGLIGRTTLIITVLLTLGGCATLRQFGPSVQVASVTPGQYIALKRGDISPPASSARRPPNPARGRAR